MLWRWWLPTRWPYVASPSSTRHPWPSRLRRCRSSGSWARPASGACRRRTRPAAPPAGMDALVSSADVVLVDGHHAELALAAAEAARRARVPVLLDGGSWKPSLHRLLDHVDAAICSADFAAPDGSSTVDSLLGAGVRSVAVTH